MHFLHRPQLRKINLGLRDIQSLGLSQLSNKTSLGSAYRSFPQKKVTRKQLVVDTRAIVKTEVNRKELGSPLMDRISASLVRWDFLH
ncbi:Hypothetical protein NTJ_13046 [Nesidiocoris tenuis]|uniref:Uncharacterized protein n=1 Tax=Nesidiocoris tenuis TaxID=355587 RepID=A0ABN7B9D1_9HEMI|nr:Hypothetical protein NTJ_13046 [Nesidiocoris tenuis]